MYSLDKDEYEIAIFLAQGLEVKEIAEETNRSRRCITYKLCHLRTTLNCKTNAQLMHELHKNGVFR